MANQKTTNEMLENVMLDTRLDVAVESLKVVLPFFGSTSQAATKLREAIEIIEKTQNSLRGFNSNVVDE